jgi:general secretion pathway protein G
MEGKTICQQIFGEFPMLNIKKRGVTYLEMLLSVLILTTLVLVASPMAENDYRRNKETLLRQNLMAMREAIDKYWQEENRKNPKKSYDSKYPKSLRVLVEKHYLRSIPEDPMTGKRDWRVISSTDKPDTIVSNRDNVFDVRSKSDEIGSNGLPYNKW